MSEQKRTLLSWYLTKYMAVEVLGSFLMGTAIFLLIMLTFQAIRLSEFVVVHQVGMKDVGRISVYLMLSFVPIAVPIAFLFSVLMGISRANSEGEVVALQSNGISLFQMFLPLGIFSVVITLVTLYSALYSVPQGNRKFELLIEKLGNERAMAALKPGVFQEGFFGLVLFAEQIIPVKNELKKVFIYDERDESNPLAITAEAGLLKNIPQKSQLTLRLTQGSILVDSKKSEGPQQKIDFDVYDINLEMGERGNSWREYSPPSFNFDQLKTRLKETLPDPPMHRKLEVELHRRFSLSFACVVFAILGFVIGTRSNRGIRSTAVVLCLIVGLIYWLSYVGANALALSGWVVPWLGVWAPNVVFVGLGMWLYRKRAY
ncbi:YjgP/YjgQ family permease [bacterium]|nr:YjgP/YjgQ family permease [bacterium]